MATGDEPRRRSPLCRPVLADPAETVASLMAVEPDVAFTRSP